MKPKILLRIASGLMIFHLLGHSFGHLNWKKADDTVKQGVINEMTGHEFPFMGNLRSMGDYFEGYGYASSVALILMAGILWIVSGSTNNNSLPYNILLLMTICLFVWSLDEFIYFFPFAAGITLLAALLTLVATMQLRSQKSM